MEGHEEEGILFITRAEAGVKPWFHVKIKLFERILVFYFNTEPRLK